MLLSRSALVLFSAFAMARDPIVPGTSTFCRYPDHQGIRGTDCHDQDIVWDECLEIKDSNVFGNTYASWTVNEAIRGDSKCTFFWDHGCQLKDAYWNLDKEYLIVWIDDIKTFEDAFGDRMKRGPVRSYRCQKCDQDTSQFGCRGYWS